MFKCPGRFWWRAEGLNTEIGLPHVGTSFWFPTFGSSSHRLQSPASLFSLSTQYQATFDQTGTHWLRVLNTSRIMWLISRCLTAHLACVATCPISMATGRGHRVDFAMLASVTLEPTRRETYRVREEKEYVIFQRDMKRVLSLSGCFP